MKQGDIIICKNDTYIFSNIIKAKTLYELSYKDKTGFYVKEYNKVGLVAHFSFKQIKEYFTTQDKLRKDKLKSII